MLNYLIVEDFAGQAVPFLFPQKVDHEDMREQLPYGRIIAGGQARLAGGEVVCGGSCSIPEIGSRPVEDAALIAASLSGLV